ncbi:hypothetical protein FB459_1915 [Yimella lutea]|uniref:Uncharacterized protein n=1 Tax=Yimella lutea TaxID=587872 RepID=A0A542EGL9_9MICO|nr:hypothetical protein [Yimella lutea]TQJ14454.1 hypothetical protein FB459_1915 [Yimella lutea]
MSQPQEKRHRNDEAEVSAGKVVVVCLLLFFFVAIPISVVLTA